MAQFAFEGLLILIAAVLIYAGATPLSTDLDMITVALCELARMPSQTPV